MYQSFKKSLSNWNDTTTDREKLQHAYIAVAVILLIIAGVFGLLNQGLGQQILTGAIAAGVIFLINAIAWALLQSFVLMHVSSQPEPTPAATKPKTTPKKRNK